MPQQRRIFSLDDRTVELLDLLKTERGLANTSELIRTLIIEAAIAENITSDYGDLPSTAERKRAKSDIASRLDRMEVALSKLSHQMSDIKEYTYETRDGVNSYLNFLGVENSDTADDNINSQTIHKSLQQAKQNYNSQQRQNSINKANFGGGY